jgi:hypothetical protein
MGGYDYTAVPAPLLSHNGEKGGPESVPFHGPRRRLGQFPQPLSFAITPLAIMARDFFAYQIDLLAKLSLRISGNEGLWRQI